MHRVWNEAFPGGIDMNTTQSRNLMRIQHEQDETYTFRTVVEQNLA